MNCDDDKNVFSKKCQIMKLDVVSGSTARYIQPTIVIAPTAISASDGALSEWNKGLDRLPVVFAAALARCQWWAVDRASYACSRISDPADLGASLQVRVRLEEVLVL